MDWPDQTIRSTALWYIGKHAMAPASWRYTLLGDSPPELGRLVEFQPGEFPLVSFFLAEASWYVFTTRRVLGCYSGARVGVAALDVLKDDFDNFKGYGGRETEVMVLQLAGGGEVGLEYETGRASMGPIYYFMYWKRKFPILDKLKG
jgi:hypothetical protein